MKKFLTSIICAVVCCFSALAFTACGGQQYTYTEFQQAYVSFIENNKIDSSSNTGLFDENGLVKVNYTNDALKAEINSNVNSKYTRLSSDLDSNQSVFEPALKASLLYVSEYINIKPANEIPRNVSTELYSKLNVLSEKTELFLNEVFKLNIRKDFDANGVIEQLFLDNLSVSFYELLLCANDFSRYFIEVANKYIWQSVEEFDSFDRVTNGFIKEYYLEKLAQSADIYTRGYLSGYYNQVLVNGGTDYFTSLNFNKNVNGMLKAYLDNKLVLADFESREGIMNSLEEVAVNSYKASKDYEVVFNNGFKVFNYALNNINDMTINLDEDYNANDREQAYKIVVYDFLAVEYENSKNFIVEMLEKIKNCV